MRLLPSGSAAILVELEDLAEVHALHATLVAHPPRGVVDLVPAARTVLVVTDPAATSLGELARSLRETVPAALPRPCGELLEIPVTYDGVDLAEVAERVGCAPDELARRHTATEWTVAFCGFAPGFAYLTSTDGGWDVPRRPESRREVPAGSVALGGQFSAVYPRASPGGWQLIGRTGLTVFDVEAEPPALLRPGMRVRFTDPGRA